jgi:uncharacterized membrane protein YkgB
VRREQYVSLCNLEPLGATEVLVTLGVALSVSSPAVGLLVNMNTMLQAMAYLGGSAEVHAVA